MKPVWRRIGNEIVILSDREYRFHWQDADLAAALYLSLMGDYEQQRAKE